MGGRYQSAQLQYQLISESRHASMHAFDMIGEFLSEEHDQVSRTSGSMAG